MCRQVFGCIQQVEASRHRQESRDRQVHVGDSRQRCRWVSGMNVNNRETHRGPSDKCPENEELNCIVHMLREEECGAKVPRREEGHTPTPPLANIILQCLPASVSPCLPVPIP